jgi:hypothetical protein
MQILDTLLLTIMARVTRKMADYPQETANLHFLRIKNASGNKANTYSSFLNIRKAKCVE